MSWRTVIISSQCKLDLKMGYMVVRGEITQRIFLDEIAVVLIENPTVSMTGCLLEALTEKKIRVIFCNSKRFPYAELAPYYGSHDTSRKVKMQTAWDEATRGRVWRRIISQKIRLQAEHLAERGRQAEAELLFSYIPQIEPHDATNREGHAAKVYFNALFGMAFKRDSDDVINAALNYGYSIILSAFNRAIVSAGYMTQFGIHHDNVYNHFNLSSDMMEPFRILVDRAIAERQFTEFDKNVRYMLVDILNGYVMIDGMKQTVLNAIEIYARSVFAAMNDDDPGQIRFYSL